MFNILSLKEIPAFSDLYSFYCLTIIIYIVFWNKGDYPVFSNIIRSSSWVYSEEKKLSDHESDISMYQEFKIVQ